jgi:Protein of unknown function (DUF433)
VQADAQQRNVGDSARGCVVTSHSRRVTANSHREPNQVCTFVAAGQFGRRSALGGNAPNVALLKSAQGRLSRRTASPIPSRLYLPVPLDLFSRRVVGSATSAITTACSLCALCRTFFEPVARGPACCITPTGEESKPKPAVPHVVTFAMVSLSRITHDPKVMGGRPCIRGLRVTVGTVMGLLAC